MRFWRWVATIAAARSAVIVYRRLTRDREESVYESETPLKQLWQQSSVEEPAG